MAASVAIAYLGGLLESLRQNGQLDAALHGAGIRADEVADPDQRISFKRYIELWQQAVGLIQQPLLGLQVGQQFHPGNFGDLASILIAAPDLQAAIEQLIRYCV